MIVKSTLQASHGEVAPSRSATCLPLNSIQTKPIVSARPPHHPNPSPIPTMLDDRSRHSPRANRHCFPPRILFTQSLISRYDSIGGKQAHNRSLQYRRQKKTSVFPLIAQSAMKIATCNPRPQPSVIRPPRQLARQVQD